MATNLEHNDAQELVKQSGNILQLTIRKPDGTLQTGPLSPTSPGYGTQLSVEVNDYNSIPKGFGTGIPLNGSYSNSNASPNYSTTPRNFGSQYQPRQPARIVAQPTGAYTNNFHEDVIESDGPNFPDYTLAYKKQEIVHDSPGGPDNIRGFIPPSEDSDYSTKSLPRRLGGHSNNVDSLKDIGGPPAYEPRAENDSQNSFNPGMSVEAKFGTRLPFHSSPNNPQQIIVNPPAQISQPPSNSAQPTYNSLPRPFSPSTYSGPVSPRTQASVVSGFHSREQSLPAGNLDSQTPTYQTTGSDQSNIHGSGTNVYSTLPHSKPPSYITNNNNNNSYNIYKSAPQPYSAPKPYAPTQTASSLTFSQSQPFQSTVSPAPTSGVASTHTVIRKVSFDQNSEENGMYIQPTNYTARPYRPPQAATIATFTGPTYSQPTSQHDDSNDNLVTDFSAPVIENIFQQPSKLDEVYTAVPFTPCVGPPSPRSAPSGEYGVPRYDPSTGVNKYDQPSSVSDGVNSLNLGPKKFPTSQVSPTLPPAPPPACLPPPPPPPPPALPLNGNPVPYRRPNYQQTDQFDEQKVPDQLLNTMAQSAKGGGPKPFSYGIDLTELKKKIGPPTAPKPKAGQPNFTGQVEEPEAPRQYGGPSKKPVGQVQSDYFIKRDDDADPTRKASKKPAGQVQTDYFLSRQTGPRSEIDESPININMGTDPKKQSKSFKVLQWMTETENDEPEEPSQKPKRTKDPERRHNAEDDEMRFSGLHSKSEIPSKTFGILQRISSNDDSTSVQNGKATLDVGDADEAKRSNGEVYGRYKGNSIPSPSFRLLQTWAELDPDTNITVNKVDSKKELDDELADTSNNEEMADKRYKGGNIPSKVFKHLQKTLGDDTLETPPQPHNNPIESELPIPEDAALISDF